MQVLIDIPNDARESIENGSFGVKYNIYDLCGWIMNWKIIPADKEDE